MRNLVVVLALAACGKAKPADDWTKTPFKVLDASTGGVAYQISLPENWEPRKPPEEGWAPTTGDQFQRPSAAVSNVSLDLASSLESAIAAAGAKPENLTRKETKPDGYALTEIHDHSLIRVTRFEKVGGSYLWCTATQANDGGIPSFEKAKAALVKICDSVTPK